jgi:hypothetical protein
MHLTRKRLEEWEALCAWLEERPYNASYRPQVNAHLTAQVKDYPAYRRGQANHDAAKRIEAERKELAVIYWATGFGWRLRKDYKAKLVAARERVEADETPQ